MTSPVLYQPIFVSVQRAVADGKYSVVKLFTGAFCFVVHTTGVELRELVKTLNHVYDSHGLRPSKQTYSTVSGVG